MIREHIGISMDLWYMYTHKHTHIYMCVCCDLTGHCCIQIIGVPTAEELQHAGCGCSFCENMEVYLLFWVSIRVLSGWGKKQEYSINFLAFTRLSTKAFVVKLEHGDFSDDSKWHSLNSHNVGFTPNEAVELSRNEIHRFKLVCNRTLYTKRFICEHRNLTAIKHAPLKLIMQNYLGPCDTTNCLLGYTHITNKQQVQSQ